MPSMSSDTRRRSTAGCPVSNEFEWRPWQPGDGLHCSHRQRGADCGLPVLVGTPLAQSRRVQRRILCEIHVAGFFIGGGLARAYAEADRQARETVLFAYWDEYQRDVVARKAKALAEALSGIPDELRPLIERGLAAREEAAQ